MKVTITDVAKHAGVSIKTVSRVMNNEVSVREATREKILASVKELNYQPNLSARNLAGSKSFTIAYVYDNPNAYYVIDMQEGILAACRQQNFELLIYPCDSRQDNITDEVINMVKHARIAGLVLTPPFSEMPDFVARINELDVKVVRIMSGTTAPNDLSICVMVNDRDAAQNITQHLIDLGHKNIGFIAGGAEHMSTIERYEGYREALKANQIKFNKNLVIQGEYSFESGVQGAKTLLSSHLPDSEKPTAIVSCNDEIAAGALYAARLMNITIPDQLSITGFENSPFSRQTWPKLTTANQPNREIAKNATNILITQVRKQEDKNIINQYVPQLIVRGSTGQIELNKTLQT